MDDMLYMTVHLAEMPFWYRVKEGLKYIFGYKCRYGHFDEVAYHRHDVAVLRDSLDKWLKEREDENEYIPGDTSGILHVGDFSAKVEGPVSNTDSRESFGIYDSTR